MIDHLRQNKMGRYAACGALSWLLVAASLAMGQGSAGKSGGAVQARSDRDVLNAIFGEAFLAENVHEVRRRAAGMSAEDRVAFLAQWVLPEPGSGSRGFRMAGEFTQTRPPPVLQSLTGQSASNDGAELVSPVYDLLDAAKELGKLESLRRKIEAVPDSADEYQQRGKAALLFLVHLERGDREAAAQAMDTLYALASATTPAGIADLWPQTLAVHRAVRYEGGHALIGDLLGSMHQRHTMRADPEGIEFWHTHIASLMGRHQHVVRGGAGETFDSPEAFRDWVPVVRARARSRGAGHALVRWLRNDEGEVHHLSGHQEEYLFYRSPLRGNFAITCEIGAYGTTQVLAAGGFLGPRSELDQVEYGAFRRGAAGRKPIDPPLGKPEAWVHYRASFRDGVCTVYFNGREVHSQPLPEHYDPWIGIRSWWRNGGRIRDVRIAGEPEVPEEVVLSASPDLAAWLPYHEESIGYEGARWQHVADPQSSGWIVGRRGADLSGTFSESLLTYQRPLVEDGSIEYEFFYEPGRFEAHPAIGRAAFLLRSEGVRLHWITDSPFDPTDLPPDNIFDEPRHRRGPTPLPLRPADWNRLRLSIAGDTMSLTLNGQLIYECPLEAGNTRTFGLFHYAGDSEVRVRNVVMRGDWPRIVPSVADQELADPVVAQLDADLARLGAVFTHDFAQEGLNAQYFQTKNAPGGQLTPRPDGLHVVRPASGAWISTEVAAQFTVRGDFDLTAEFDQFQTSGDKDACLMLVARLADERLRHCRSVRDRHPSQRQQFQISLSEVEATGKRSYVTRQFACEANSGRLRLARRGKEVYYLFADGDSPNFRLFGKETASAADTLPGGIDLSAIANGTATVSGVWKNLRIAAEELLVLPDPAAKPKNVLFVMNADGTGLKQITQETAEHQSHGSPDWSPDGKQIAFDGWSGTAESSHIFLVNADGTDMRDLGVGVMPTFSPDGRRLAFTWSGQGMAVMDTRGGARQVIADEGWGAQWSPDGKWIAYESSTVADRQRVSNITIIDVATKQKRLLLQGALASRYSQIYWNMEWSPDSRRICFKGALRSPAPGGAASEMAITNVSGSSRGFQVLTTANIQTDFSWRSDGKDILISMHSAEHGGNRLFLCDPRTGAIRLLPNQPLDQHNVSGVWSPDGRRIVFSSQRDPQPVAWRAEGEHHQDLRSKSP